VHTHRTTPAKGYRAPGKRKIHSVGIMVRLMPFDFARLRAQAIARNTPLAAIVRDAIAVYLRSRNGKD
jgi:hypothetical protein